MKENESRFKAKAGMKWKVAHIRLNRDDNPFDLLTKAIAGPTANILVAIVIAILLQLLPASTSKIWPGLSFLFVLQIWAILFNLLPVPGLDGYGVIQPFLNPAIQLQMERIRPYAIWVLFLAVWYLPFFNDVLWTFIYIISSLFGVNWDLVAQGQDFLLGFFG